ncbi:collagenase [Ornithinibacillus sp. BX22]|uniref:Collagenase n=2 Tax=Ornithinibacillus TaxID=484508 RepID=A0A923L2S9_9BACI|nr:MULTISPECIES: collagenase [Ornithinibacillus]MBC5635320.1 collagenase [Ornithinibacillus hominis]MBS3678889.1 collagenase [Ornithinibacillus massiliensis]
MKQIYAFEKVEDYMKHQPVMEFFMSRLSLYQRELEEHYALTELPKGIVWTTAELATETFSTVPIPAYTNKDLIYFTPDIEAWRSLFLRQLEGLEDPEIESFYETISEKHIFSILGHELTHHLDLFPDEFDEEREDSIWFEEGMCEFLPRKAMLDEHEFNEFTKVETELVAIFKEKYGKHSLDYFGQASYKGSLTSIMYDYWRSFLAVKYLVEEWANGDTMKVFQAYHDWHYKGRKQPLTDYFGISRMFD